MPEIAYVNGVFMPLDQATVHVEDRGFQFADGVYEVLRTYGGKPFATDEHLARLFRSLQAVDLRQSFTHKELNSIIHEAVRRAGFAESVVYLQITRGRAPRQRGFPTETHPTLVLTVRELESVSQLRETGIKVITLLDQRWARCDIKSVSLLPNALAYQSAKNAGALDAIFIEANGSVTESTGGNVFIVSNQRLRTPPKGPKILAGVTREKILQAAESLGIPSAAEWITKPELLAADEVLLTSTTKELLPVVAIDDKPIGTGKPGRMTKRLHEEFVRMFVLK